MKNKKNMGSFATAKLQAKRRSLLAIIAMVAVIGFSFAACDNGNGGGPGNNPGSSPQTVTYTGVSGDTTYTLRITENTARYAAQSGDAYRLTVGTKRSTGTVETVSGGTLTLKPSNAATTFTATVSGSSLTALNGTITYTDTTEAPAPGALTTGGGGGSPFDGTWTSEEDATDIITITNGKNWTRTKGDAKTGTLDFDNASDSDRPNILDSDGENIGDAFIEGGYLAWTVSGNWTVRFVKGSGGSFVAVTNITGVPTTATVGTALTLTGTVVPSTATNKTIAWSVVSGTATVSGSTLNATAAGTVTVRATIANGTAQGTPYTKNFTITVSGSSGGGDGSVPSWWAGTWIQTENINGGSPTATDNTLTLKMEGNITGNWNLSIKRQNNINWTNSGSMWGVTQNSEVPGGGRGLWIVTIQNARYDLRFETISGTKVKFTAVSQPNDTDAQLLLGVWEKQ